MVGYALRKPASTHLAPTSVKRWLVWRQRITLLRIGTKRAAPDDSKSPSSYIASVGAGRDRTSDLPSKTGALPLRHSPWCPFTSGRRRSDGSPSFAGGAFPRFIAAENSCETVPDAASAALVLAFTGLTDTSSFACRAHGHDTSLPLCAPQETLYSESLQLATILPVIGDGVNKMTGLYRASRISVSNARIPRNDSS